MEDLCVFKMHISSLRASVCDVFTAFQLLVLLLLSHLLYSGKFQVKTSVLKCYAPFWTTAIFFFNSQVCLFLLYHPQMFCPPRPHPNHFFSPPFNNCASPGRTAGRFFSLCITLHRCDQEFHLYFLPIF